MFNLYKTFVTQHYLLGLRVAVPASISASLLCVNDHYQKHKIILKQYPSAVFDNSYVIKYTALGAFLGMTWPVSVPIVSTKLIIDNMRDINKNIIEDAP